VTPEEQLYFYLAVASAALLALTIIGIIIGLIYMRFFFARPCRKIKSAFRSPDGVVEITMADGTNYFSYGE
jgi:hypothetical protein